MAEDIFGLPLDPPAEEITPEETDEAPQAEPPVEETAPAEEPEQAPESPAEASTEEPEEEGPRLWANKYETPEDLEHGYNESREMWRRAVEARKAEEQARQELEAQNAQLQAVFKQAIPYLQQAAQREQLVQKWASEYRDQTGEWPEGYRPPTPAQQQQAVAPEQVNAMIEQRLAWERQQMAAQMEQQRRLADLQNAVDGFYADHPEVKPRSPADNEITDTLQALNEAWDPLGYEVDVTDRGSLEVLYEAARRPALAKVLAMRPDYFVSEDGLTLARGEASILEGATITQGTRTVPASQVGSTQGQRRPFSETATGGEGPQEEAPLTPWEEVKRQYRRDHPAPGSGGSIFFE